MGAPKGLRSQYLDILEEGDDPTPWDWISPFHIRDAKAMRLDYPRDWEGRKIPGSRLEIIQDRRPEILIPHRTPYRDPIS